MSHENGFVPSAGWFADPLDPSRQRWWDGAGWTERVNPAEASDLAQTLADASAPVPGALRATEQPVIVLDTSRFAPNQPAASPPLTRRELRKRVGPLTYGQERWRPNLETDSRSDLRADDSGTSQAS